MGQKALEFLNLGVKPFQEVWDLQRLLRKERIENPELPGVILLCEHDPVITKGKSTQSTNLLLPEEEITSKGISVESIERGGDVTYHGPGILVGYPILNLNNWKRDVHWYMRSLEEVIIQTLCEFEIEGIRIPGKTGVWVSTQNGERKIASIGVHLSKWVTLHGFAINVESKPPFGFSMINPCGFKSLEITWMKEESGMLIGIESIFSIVEENFINIFSKIE